MAQNLVTLFKHSTTAFIILTFSLILNSWAQSTPQPNSGRGWHRSEDGRLIVNLSQSCNQKSGVCQVAIGSIRVTIDGSYSSHYGGYTNASIISNVPIAGVQVMSPYNVKMDEEGSRARFFSVNVGPGDSKEWFFFGKPSKKQIFSDAGAYFQDIALDVGMINIREDLKSGAENFANFLRISLERAEEFQANIKNSDRKHVDLIKQALKSTLFMLEDENGNIKIPVTSVQLQEQMRMIMVLATVLNDLLIEYGDVAAIRSQVKSLSELAFQIRSAYDWKDSFSGTSSKGMAVLAELVELELRIISSEDSLPESAEIYNKLRVANYQIGAMVWGTNGGDIRAVEPTREFAKIWNDQTWQNRLSALLNIKDTAKAEIIFKSLRLLLLGTEQMSALTNIQFNIPRDVEAKFKK